MKMKKKCPKCNIVMVEVKDGKYKEMPLKHLYPKDIYEVGLEGVYKERVYHEYRFYCKKCKKEYVLDTTPYNKPYNKCFFEVPVDSQFKYSPKQKLLLLNKKDVIDKHSKEYFERRYAKYIKER